MQKYSQLTSNRAVFTCSALPNTQINISNVELPSISLPVAEQSTPLVQGKEPGSKIEFEELSFTFLLDEDMKTWLDIFEWMKRITPFNNQNQYSYEDKFADGTLIIMSSHNNPVMRVKFHDLFPINLGAIEFTEEDSEAIMKTSTVTFEYFYYEVDIVAQ